MIEYDVKSASPRELLSKLDDCQAMIASRYIAEDAKQLAGRLRHRVKEEILLRMESNEPKEEPKTEITMSPFEALDLVKSLRKGFRECIGSLYKNVAVNQIQTHLEECVAKWGDVFMDCVQRELCEETSSPEITEKLWGDKGKRELVFAEYLEKALPLREVTDEEMKQAVEEGRALQQELHEEFKALRPDAETMNMRFQ